MAKIPCLPKSFRKLGGISLLSVSVRLSMVVEPSFEFVLGTPNVMLGGIDRSDGGFVNRGGVLENVFGLKDVLEDTFSSPWPRSLKFWKIVLSY